MANTTREQLKQYCLRRLGKPVLEINVHDDQLEDLIDDALQFYRDYHFDGTERTFLKKTITTQDVTNRYIPIAENVVGIINLYPSGILMGSSMFNVKYQWALNNMHDLSSGFGASIHDYTMKMEQLTLIDEVFNGKQLFRFNRHNNRLYIDDMWGQGSLAVDQVIVAEAYAYLDTTTFSDVWNDWWLKQYTTQLFKRAWGTNLSKFQNLQLPGGVMMDGLRILQEAEEEIKRLESEVINNYGGLVMDMIG
jgi:hypothetical protein